MGRSSKTAVFSRGLDLAILEINCNRATSPGLTWNLGTLTGSTTASCVHLEV